MARFFESPGKTHTHTHTVAQCSYIYAISFLFFPLKPNYKKKDIVVLVVDSILLMTSLVVKGRCDVGGHILETQIRLKREFQAPFPPFLLMQNFEVIQGQKREYFFVSRSDKCKPTVTCLVEMLSAVSVDAT